MNKTNFFSTILKKQRIKRAGYIFALLAIIIAAMLYISLKYNVDRLNQNLYDLRNNLRLAEGSAQNSHHFDIDKLKDYGKAVTKAEQYVMEDSVVSSTLIYEIYLAVSRYAELTSLDIEKGTVSLTISSSSLSSCAEALSKLCDIESLSSVTVSSQQFNSLGRCVSVITCKIV